MKTDAQLRTDVQDELAWDPAFKATTVGVIVNDGVVTLIGHLASHAEKFAVERAARRVKGVQALVVELTVRLASDLQRGDAEIALAIEQIFEWSVLVPGSKIQATVEHGWVTLRGEVAWHYQRQAAESLVHGLHGVAGVSNLVTLEPKVVAAEVQKNIHAALERQAHREADRLQVQIEGSQVTLRGKVSSWAERDAAQGAAWSAPGVDAVLNHIVVES